MAVILQISIKLVVFMKSLSTEFYSNIMKNGDHVGKIPLMPSSKVCLPLH
jgi:hypothetical protein